MWRLMPQADKISLEEEMKDSQNRIYHHVAATDPPDRYSVGARI